MLQHMDDPMNLTEELNAIKAGFAERRGPEKVKLVEDENNALLGLAAGALKAGAMLPAASLLNHKGAMTDIGALAAQSALVIVFYRGGWCPYCNMELRAYQQALPEFTALGAKLVAVSPETPDNTLSTAEKNDVQFEVLSDAEGKFADALGIRFVLSPKLEALYREFGLDLPARNGDSKWALPMPSVFVVEKGGRIAFASVDPDYRTRLEPADALAALKAIAARAA